MDHPCYKYMPQLNIELYKIFFKMIEYRKMWQPLVNNGRLRVVYDQGGALSFTYWSNLSATNTS